MDDVDEICRLKYRYVRMLDTKDWGGFAECLTPDVVGRYGGLDLDGRDALVGFMRENMPDGPDGVVTMHLLHHPEITVDGDEARGTWYLQDRVVVEASRFVLEGAAFYDDRYVRTPEGWRIAGTGYRRTHEMTWSMDDVPSLRLKRGS